MSVQEMATRKSLGFKKECATENPHAHKIIDVDCEYDNGKFVMSCLPCPLPSLFTIRFTAPADFTQGDVVVVRNKELPVRTPGMVNASTGLYKAGAVMHCDIDMDRELAFFWQGAGSAGGILPNLSYSEQFAGFYDEDGDKVYVISIDLGNIPASGSKFVPHSIVNFKRIVSQNLRWYGATSPGHGLGGRCGEHSSGSAYVAFYLHSDSVHINAYGNNWSASKVIATYYYTCSDH